MKARIIDDINLVCTIYYSPCEASCLAWQLMPVHLTTGVRGSCNTSMTLLDAATTWWR